MSSGAEAEKIQKYKMIVDSLREAEEKDIKLMNSRRDCAESGGDIRKELDSGPVGTRRCLMPVRSHVARFLAQWLTAVVLPCQMRVPMFIT